MEYLPPSTRKRMVAIAVAIAAVSIYLLCNPQHVAMRTVIDDNNLHSGNIRESIREELQPATNMFDDFVRAPYHERDATVMKGMGSLGFETQRYHDKYGVSGVLATLRPRRADDRSCILVMGRYSRNTTSPLNPVKMPALNTLSTMYTLAVALSKQEWIGRNVLFAFLDDSTPVGVNDFFNEYAEHPVCGRIVAGMELDVQPSSYGATRMNVLVGTHPFLSNQDIYNGLRGVLQGNYNNFDILTTVDKHFNSSLEQALLHASSIRYTDATEGPAHNVDMVTIQTTFNDSLTHYSVPHRVLTSSYLSLIRSFNNLYQQLQYSTIYYIPLDIMHYIPFPIIVAVLLAVMAPMFAIVCARRSYWLTRSNSCPSFRRLF